jgi:hypothetical protein
LVYQAGGGLAPRRLSHGRLTHARSREGWLIVIALLLGVLVFVSFAGSVHRALAGAGIFVVVCSFAPSRLGRPAAAAAAVIVAALCLLVAPSSGALLFASLVLGCTVVGRSAAALFPSLELLAWAVSPNRLVRESVLLEERASTELTRARRYERPLSVVMLNVDAGGKRAVHEVANAGHALARELRLTDVVGITETGDAVAILPETGRDVVTDLVGRLASSVLAAGTTGSIGTATFPDDAVTWRELMQVAAGRSVPLVATWSGPNDSSPPGARLGRQEVVG